MIHERSGKFGVKVYGRGRHIWLGTFVTLKPLHNRQHNGRKAATPKS